jgi:hypothetical protein
MIWTALAIISVKVGPFPGGEGGRIVWLSWVGSGSSLSTSCACTEVVLYGLAGCCPVLGNSSGILSDKVISTLSGGEAVRSPSVKGDRISPSIIGVNRAVCGIWLLDKDNWNPLPICYTGIYGAGYGKVICYGSVPCRKEGADIAWSLDIFLLISGKAVSRYSAPLGKGGRILISQSSVGLSRATDSYL